MAEQFFVLDHIQASDYRLFAGGQWVNDTTQRCSVCGVFTDSSEPATLEIALNHVGRRGFVEYLWNSHSMPIFRHDVVDLWYNEGLTGFKIKPVRIVGWYEKPQKPLPADIPVYYGLTTKSKSRLNEPLPLSDSCPACGYVRYAFPEVGFYLPDGLSIDQSSWDGSDFFGLAQYRFVFCTRRAAETTLRAGYNRHIAFVRVENWCRWKEFNVREWTPQKYREYIESFLIRRPEKL